MTAVDNLWYLADEADQQAEQTYHDLQSRHDGVTEFTKTRWVSRRRFQTVAQRISGNGLPYGAHALVTDDSGSVLLVRHRDVDMWVLPGGEVDDGESFKAAARRELHEEAGIEATFDGLALLGRVEFHGDGHTTWGALPIYEGAADSTELSVDDPDGEIVQARWFETLPDDARDRSVLRSWLEDGS
ncbi:NUDIX hydrolase [Halapricum desulfuricans]|uniref:NUDIX family hydrolase n=1 Tax=Halapricum desulfuricans TaxID=2841257 RepID=A0A897NCG9_9EURY|nr:NUDIX domain-containing protein [Halapricum desulfuricans]QSG08679.1 NUDIX family hydrolase [Halapricum desulfuricans]